MDKQQTLDFIRRQRLSGVITKEDLESFITDRPADLTQPAQTESSSIGVINILYVIGGLIILVGVGILLAQNWEEIGFLGRITATMGLAVVTFVLGMITVKTQPVISQVMFTLASGLGPFGVSVILYESDVKLTFTHQIWIAGAFFAVFVAAYYYARLAILRLISIIFGSWLYYAIILRVLEGALFSGDLIKWASIILGLVYILIGYNLESTTNSKEDRAVQRLLYGVGTLGILGWGITFGGVWDFIFLFLVFGAFYLSIFVRSRAMLFLAALFIMAYIIKITSKYFISSLSWPIALILCGALIIGTGYMTFKLNREYLGSKVPA